MVVELPIGIVAYVWHRYCHLMIIKFFGALGRQN